HRGHHSSENNVASPDNFPPTRFMRHRNHNHNHTNTSTNSPTVPTSPRRMLPRSSTGVEELISPAELAKLKSTLAREEKRRDAAEKHLIEQKPLLSVIRKVLLPRRGKKLVTGTSNDDQHPIT